MSEGVTEKVLLVLDALGVEDILIHELKLFDDNCIDPEQVVLEVFAVTEKLSIDSEKVTEMVEPIETDDAESDGEVELTVGEVVSVVVVLAVEGELSSVVVEVVEEPLSLLLLQEMTVKLKRNMETMMSICLTWFPIGVLGELDI